MRTLVTLATFDQRWQAERAEKLLAEQGIESEIEDDTAAQESWYLLKPHAAARLLADASVAPRAKELLAETRGIIRCPECHESEVQYPQMSRKFPMPLWAFALLAKVGFLDTEYYCECCHHTWPVKQHPVEKEPDLLGWPRKQT